MGSTPFGSIISALNFSDKRKITATLDVALGGTVTLGISLTLLNLSYRMLKAALGKTDIRNGGVTDEQRKQGLLAGVIWRAWTTLLPLRNRGKDNDSSPPREGDPYFHAAYNGGSAKTSPPPNAEDLPCKYFASCHCKSIRFTFSQPPTPSKRCDELHAYDCAGKIRYPHIRSITSNDFQLLRGTDYLKIYYVNLPFSEIRAARLTESHVSDAKMAAHSFCIRCGVHLFRAPDSTVDVLEINANCIDYGDREQKHYMPQIKVEFYNNDAGNGLSDGRPILDQWSGNTRNMEERSINSNKMNFRSGWNNSEDLYSLNENSLMNTKNNAKGSRETPQTELDDQSFDDTTSQLSSSIATMPLVGDSVSTAQVDASNTRNWTGSSTMSLPPMRPPQSSANGKNNKTLSKKGTSDKKMRDQLKHYMKRHISTTNSDTEKSFHER
eukprot:CAMPEP_0194358450 /NCGR_PEP_ID=MMETSP0174-20130528/5648_1 /TAXON_ID=216777 /ORGANISM="Proboscia alata, Strain PI-D3" /LENGTH=438 /DNA_ID=CAMNT_0039128761 /DNA_START=40 /DNA_END=1356 /DNA_ORIENTATION=-